MYAATKKHKQGAAGHGRLPDGGVLDVLGIGFGPSNIALAIALEERASPLSVLFLESRPGPQWQPGMLFGGSDIQNHPLRDLVTPRNPRSRYTFTNFLFEHDRLFEHLNLGLTYPMRLEYAQYIAWVASHFEAQVHYERRVGEIRAVEDERLGPLYEVLCQDGERYRARSVVAGPGRTPYVPQPLAGLATPHIVHLTDYLPALARLRARLGEQRAPRIAVVGGSQSAVEILLHLSEEWPQAEVLGLSRRFGYRLKDSSPFTGEVYFPEFVDLFYAADAAQKNRLRADLHLTNYAAADGDVLDRLYQRIYMNRLQGNERLQVWRCAELQGARLDGERVLLDVQRQDLGGVVQALACDLVISATGFRDLGGAEHQERCPPLLQGLLPGLALDAQGCIQIAYDYTLRRPPGQRGGPLVLNGLCESSHGMGDAGSFSLLALRSKTIADALEQQLPALAEPDSAEPARPALTAL